MGVSIRGGMADSDSDILHAGTTYNPLTTHDLDPLEEPKARSPVGSMCYIALETPFVRNLKYVKVFIVMASRIY